MKRTWVLWIGLTVLSASVCAGMEEYAEPAPNEGSPDEVTYTVPDSKPDGNCEVTDPARPGDYEIVDPGSEGGPEVIDPKPDDGGEVIDPGVDGDPEIITRIADGEYAVIDGGLDRDYQIVTLVPEDGCEATDSTADAALRMLAAGPDADFVSTLALAPTTTELVASLGLPELPSEWGTSPINTCLNWGGMPELAQVRSGVGFDMAAQIAPYTNGTLNLPDFTGRLDNVTSQISLGARDAFGAIPIPGIAQLLANQ